MKNHAIICRGCLSRAEVRPENITQSCIALGHKQTCEACGCVQHGSWFIHAVVQELPESIQNNILQRQVNVGAQVPHSLMGTDKA